MKTEKNYIFALDLGVNSIGWAVVNRINGANANDAVQYELCGLNSRIFQEMVDAKTRTPKNQKRRQQRGMRRNLAQRKRRRAELIRCLQDNDLLPPTFDGKRANEIDRRFAERVLNKEWDGQWREKEKFHASPFAMRALGLERDLERHEFGRALLHLQKRRGYFSNRGAKYVELFEHLKVLDTEEKEELKKEKGADKETGIVLGGIRQLFAVMEKQGTRTVGEYVWRKSMDTGQSPQRITRHYIEEAKRRGDQIKDEKINFYATRKMTKDEFDFLWKKQAPPLSLNEVLRENIECLLFYQTPLEKAFQAKTGKVANYLGLKTYVKRWNKPTRGVCSFQIDKPRMAKAALPFQEARTWQVINNLLVRGKLLNAEQRQKLYEALKEGNNLNKDGRMSWSNVAKVFACTPREINYSRVGDGEEDGKSGLIGNRTANNIAGCAGAEFWQMLSEQQQEQLVTDLLTITDKKALYLRLVKQWGQEGGFGNAAFNLATEELESGYSKHCRRVWSALLLHLRGGCNYYEACQKAGYLQDKKTHYKREKIYIRDIPNIANPIVQKALYESRKVVNALVQQYGRPVEIRVEMAREMAQSKKHRKEIEDQQTENRKRNAEADDKLREYIRSGNVMGLEYMQMGGGKKRILPADRKKYIMWHHEQEYKCPYCGTRIGCADLFNGGAEIEHILPQIAFKQNYMNTVLTCRDCNQEKKGRSPYEAWRGTDKWDSVCRRISNKEKSRDDFPNMPFAKKRRIRDEKFLAAKEHSEENESEFVQRQLKDTQYIAVAVKNMLEKIGIPVRVSKGGATAELRRLWGLNNILPRHPDSGGLREDKDDNAVLQYDKDAAKESKNRMDHRHHAIDALVIAMTDTAALQEMTRRWKHFMEFGEFGDTPFPLPMRQYADSANALCAFLRGRLSRTVVSHMTKRKVYGALHEETAYGEGCYEKDVSLPTRANSRKKFIGELLAITINNKKQAIGGDGTVVQGGAQWLADDDMRDILTRYINDGNHKGYPVHPQTREFIKSVRVFCRCYVHRISVQDALEYAKKDWIPGHKTWIVDKVVHAVLQSYLNGQTPKEMAKHLVLQPPRMPLKDGKEGKGPEIKTVRVAQHKGEASVRKLQQFKIYQTGSNHHAEIFCNADGSQTQGRIISMFEAAQRRARGEAVIDKNPDEAWKGEWQFKMYLCINDMVVFDAVEEDKKLPHANPKNSGCPEERLIYRVQKMSGGSIIFRHHTLATSSNEDHYGKIQRSISQLKGCKKIEISVLGSYSNIPND